MTWVGPSRAKRSFNDEFIDIHPLHESLRQHLEICMAHNVRAASFAVHVDTVQKQYAPNFGRLGHRIQDARRRLNSNRNHRVVSRVVEQGEVEVDGGPHE